MTEQLKRLLELVIDFNQRSINGEILSVDFSFNIGLISGHLWKDGDIISRTLVSFEDLSIDQFFVDLGLGVTDV